MLPFEMKKKKKATVRGFELRPIWTAGNKLGAFPQSQLVKLKKKKKLFAFRIEFLLSFSKLYYKNLLIRFISSSHKIIPMGLHFSCGKPKQGLQMLICQGLAQSVLVLSQIGKSLLADLVTIK